MEPAFSSRVHAAVTSFLGIRFEEPFRSVSSFGTALLFRLGLPPVTLIRFGHLALFEKTLLKTAAERFGAGDALLTQRKPRRLRASYLPSKSVGKIRLLSPRAARGRVRSGLM